LPCGEGVLAGAGKRLLGVREKSVLSKSGNFTWQIPPQLAILVSSEAQYWTNLLPGGG